MEQVTVTFIHQPTYVVAHIWRIEGGPGRKRRREVSVRRVLTPEEGMSPAALLRALADELEAALEDRTQPLTQ